MVVMALTPMDFRGLSFSVKRIVASNFVGVNYHIEMGSNYEWGAFV